MAGRGNGYRDLGVWGRGSRFNAPGGLAHAMAESASVRATYDRSRFRTFRGSGSAIDLAVFPLDFFRRPELIVSSIGVTSTCTGPDCQVTSNPANGVVLRKERFLAVL
jgi:hypothetical protein